MPWFATAALLVLAQASGALRPEPAAVRLHHVHAVVADPAAAMRDAAGRVDGSVRAILQGHGPGVRMDRQYIVFDREEASVTTTTCEASLRAAVAWLTASGVAVSERELPIASALRELRCVAIAVAARQSTDIVEPLRARGVEPLATRDGEARYRLASGLIVEVMDDPDRPDTHWCPMHPDVRASGPGTCQQCNMNLVLIPPPQVGEYGLDVTIEPAAIEQLRFRFVVTDPSSARPVSQFIEVHERLFHLFIISTDLERFAHVHPERQSDGSFALTHALAPGEYMLIADVLPAAGTPQMLQRTIITPGFRGALFARPPRLAPTLLEQTDGDLVVRLSVTPLTELRPASLTFEVIDANTGQRANGLESYLGAPAHLLVVDDALQLPVHAHPDQPADAGGIDFDLRFPKAGVYKMWFQFQRNGEVHTIPFVLRVAPL